MSYNINCKQKKYSLYSYKSKSKEYQLQKSKHAFGGYNLYWKRYQQKVQRDSEKRRESLKVSVIGKDFMEKVNFSLVELSIKIHTVRKERPVIVICSIALI